MRVKPDETAMNTSWQPKLICRTANLLFAAFLAGCSQLPLDGPTYRDITTGAAASLTNQRDTIAYDYALVDINPIVIENLAEIGVPTLHHTFGTKHSSAPKIRVGVGDIVQVSVFESAAGGLFIPVEGTNRGGNFVTLPNQAVSHSGTIAVPYAGAVRAAGRTPTEIERDIERKLSSRAIEPQIVVTVIEQNSATVAVVGDTLNGANKFKLTGSGERVLDVLSRAGGLRFAGHELFVTLQRGNRRATIHFPRLVNDPGENIFVTPGDTIYVYREPQKFVAVGALGSVSQTSGLTVQFNFDQERLSLNEALARAGGLQDHRADPAQVFLYRVEHRETLARIGVNLSRFAPEQHSIPTVYRANFRDPSSFFFAQKFQMRNKDIIYVANADATEVVKFLNYIRAVTSTVAGVSSDVTLTRDVLDGRHILGK